MDRVTYEAVARGELPLDVNEADSGEWLAPFRALAALWGWSVAVPPLPEAPLPRAITLLTRARASFIYESPTESLERELSIELGNAPEALTPVYRLAECWCGLARTREIDLDEKTVTGIRNSRIPEALVDIDLIHAAKALFFRVGVGDGNELDRAIHASRRAAHKARSEGVVDRELLAGILLARARRFEQRPYLSRWILDAIPTPAAWNHIVEPEWLFAGFALNEPASPLAASLLETLHTLTGAGSALPLYEHRQAASVRAARTAIEGGRLGPEVRAWLAAFGLDEIESGSSAGIDGFSKSGTPLFGLRDPFFDGWDIVVDSTGMCQRRFPSARRESDSVLHYDAERPAWGMRALVESSPQSIPLEEWFKNTFGYRYLESQHGNLRRVTLHRMRNLLPDGALIDVSDERIRLKSAAVIVLPDPASRPSLDERVLRALSAGSASTTDMARSLATPLRTIQSALKRLVEAGVCEARRVGRGYEYHIEDTSFFAPTFTRLDRLNP